MSTHPNIMVVVSDTFRRDHLGAYGNPFIRTPHLDEFARSSVVFENHLISSFPTMPARADILTGTFSYTHMGWEPLPRHLSTLPEVLSKAGYLTMGVVDTPFWEFVDREFARYTGAAPGETKRKAGEAVPFGRMGRPEDYTGIAVFLASDDAAYIVAQTYGVDGGNWMA